MVKEKFSFKDEMSALARVVSGEDALRKREEKIAEMKEEAVKEEKIERKKKIAKGEAVLKKEEEIEDKKIGRASCRERV